MIDKQIEMIESVLEDANIPRHWYSISEPFECRISIIQQDDGIHVFTPERGMRVGESIFDDWFDAVYYIADGLDLSATERVKKVARDKLIELHGKR